MLTKSRYWYSIKKLVPDTMYGPLLKTFYSFRQIGYRGNLVSCPICSRNFSAYINGHFCPSCGSGQRHRLLYLYLRNKTNFFTRPLRVLHFAPEHCFYKLFPKQKNLDYVSGDLSSPRAMMKIDMTDIRFPDDHFDVVISSHVLEHVPDEQKAMRELRRVMKSDGWAIHQAPVHYEQKYTFEDPSIQTNEDRLKYYGHIDHKRLYGRDYKNRLEQAGFVVNEDPYVTSIPEDEILKFGLDRTERIYYCTKF